MFLHSMVACTEVVLTIDREELERQASPAPSRPRTMAGRTHGQHALPITFGFNVATWLDQLIRHAERLRRVECALFVAMTGGAVGTFASLGELGPAVQAGVAAELGLRPMAVPGRNIADQFADYVCTLGLLSATCGAVARSVHTMMQTEFGEVCEPVPVGTVGSSTMPHKVNPQLSDRVLVLAARVRALVPAALEAMNSDHEADSAHSELIDGAVRDAAVLTGDVLAYLEVILAGLTFDEDRLRVNLDLSDGMVGSEAVMLALGAEIGRQQAHEVVTRAARAAAHGGAGFAELLAADPQVRAHVSPERILELLDPARQVGLSATIARETAKRAFEAVSSIS